MELPATYALPLDNPVGVGVELSHIAAVDEVNAPFLSRRQQMRMRSLLPVMPSRSQPVATVHKQLKSYAQRGVFRSFSQTRAEASKAEFRFFWLWNLPFHLSFDSRRKALTFKKLLPGVAPGSELNTRLKEFIASHSSTNQPEHRRLDPERISIQYSNLRGNVSLTFRVAGDDYEYGVRKALNLVNEIFVGFLNMYFPEYIAEHFRGPEE